jgi:hypothetical protein
MNKPHESLGILAPTAALETNSPNPKKPDHVQLTQITVRCLNLLLNLSNNLLPATAVLTNVNVARHELS